MPAWRACSVHNRLRNRLAVCTAQRVERAPEVLPQSVLHKRSLLVQGTGSAATNQVLRQEGGHRRIACMREGTSPDRPDIRGRAEAE
jgi:hypothetical protein